ncbi:MAG: 7TM diverse intracellular signaling domain-containing protein [Nevskia sp.]|nr:7TM diverse intracellular signaling domain-containing protein [Nevskia sp.]
MNRPARAAALVLLLLACAASGAAGETVRELDEVWFLQSDTPQPPAAEAPGWQRRRLPDDWNHSQPGRAGIGWYRTELDLPEQPRQPWAVDVSRFWMNAAVYVNGIAVGGEGSLTRPGASSWNRPLLFVIPPTLLHAGTNQMEIGVWAYRDVHGGLQGAELGLEAALRPLYERRYFFKVTLNQALLASTLVMAALVGLLWFRRRRDTVYAWFALTSVCWGLKIFTFLVRDPRIDTFFWAWLANAVNYWVAVSTGIMVHRYFGVFRPRLERCMIGYAAVSTALLPLFSLTHTHAVGVVLELGALATVVHVGFLAAWRAWNSHRSDEIVLAGGIVSLIGLAVHDCLLDMGLLAQQDWYLMHYGAPVLCMVLAWLLTSRFVQALNASEATAAELELRIEEKRRELDQSYRRMQDLQRRQAVAEERDRIMRDLHDGLGGQLVAALAMSQRTEQPQPAIRQTLHDALDDLRLVIDSLDPVDGDLLVLLGTARARLEPRLAQQGMRFEWQVNDLPSIQGFGPDKALQVLRIVQEAVANILKHARARTVTIRTGTEPEGAGRPAAVFIEVIDDGAGMAVERAGGRGLGNMRERASRIGGQLQLATGERGTTVRLSLPLDQAA